MVLLGYVSGRPKMAEKAGFHRVLWHSFLICAVAHEPCFLRSRAFLLRASAAAFDAFRADSLRSLAVIDLALARPPSLANSRTSMRRYYTVQARLPRLQLLILLTPCKHGEKI